MKGKIEDYQDNFDYRPHNYNSKSKKNRKYVDIYSSGPLMAKKRGKIPVLRVLLFLFFLSLGIIGGAMIYAYNTLHSINYQQVETAPTEEDADENFDPTELLNDKMVLNILLIGSDSMSTGDHGRSDSMLVVSLDVRTKKIKVTSIMRDLWVDIPKHGKDRINAAYAYGNSKLTVETIQKNFGILIDRFVCVDFEGFAKIIDTLGGIDMELSSTECQYINKYSGDPHTLKGSGVKHLTGLQALNHARNRNSKGSDYDRTMRQRDVIRAVIEKLKKSNVAKVTEIVSNIGPMITTNFKPSEITRLAKNSMTYVNYPMVEFRLPTDDNVRNETHDQKMVLAIKDMAKAKKDLKKFIYEGYDETSGSTYSAASSAAQKSVKSGAKKAAAETTKPAEKAPSVVQKNSKTTAKTNEKSAVNNKAASSSSGAKAKTTAPNTKSTNKR